jgi:hypothetical protein
LKQGLESFNFRVYFLGQVTELEHREGDLISTNRNEVISNMRSVAIDFLSYWKQLRSDNNVRFSILTTINVSEDITPDKLYGVNIDVSFKVLQTFNKCIIPMSGIPTPESQDVSIYGNDTLMVTVACGNNYEFEIRNESGDLVGTWNAITKIWTVPGGGSASIDIAVNGTPFYSGVSTNQDIPVINSADTPIGQPDGANYRIGDSELNINDNFEELIPAETIFDLYVEDTSGDPAGDYIGANTVQIDDSLITLITQAVPYALTPLRAEQPKSLSIIDEIDFDPIQVTVASDTEGAAEFVIPNGEVLVKDSAGNTLHTKVVKAGGSANQTVSDGSIILQNGNGDTLQTYTNKAQEAKVVVLPIIYLRPKPSLSSVSSIDGDDYWYKLNNPDTYVPAVVGIPALLDPSTPHKLRYKNAFGHLWRRTGINGGYYDIDTAEYKLADGTVSTQAVTFGFGADAYFIDHHTGLGYRWSLVGGGTTHAANFATAEAATYAGFNDWMICSIEEHMSLWVSLPNFNFQFPQDPNYYPMVWNSSFRFRSNHPSAPSTSMRVYTGGNYSTGLISVSNAWLPVRRHYT